MVKNVFYTRSLPLPHAPVRLWFCLVLFLAVPLLFAQTETPAGETPAAETAAAETKKDGLDAAFVLDRDIATASQAELEDWCRSLGLPAEGGRESMAARLREHYKLQPPPQADSGAAEQSAEGGTEPKEKRELIITIESARTTEYFTVAAIDEEYVRLRGAVSVSLRDGEIIHRIQAGEILYNRTRKLLTASGGVVYIKEEGDKVDTFRGTGITVNLDNWSTAFMRGVSDREISGEGTRYRFSGEVISRSGEDSTVLRRAKITNAGNPESFWSIDASRLWLLPGSDWAILNAVIKVGEIPVFYLPGFYYPANEVIFHPVLGFRSREGTFVQTTTYILGRAKPVSSEEASSITSIMGSGEGMERKREGIFLRSTGRKARDVTEPRLSFMADAYANLGYYIGSELTIPAKGSMGELSFSGGTAFTRDIAFDYSDYTPFYPAYDGSSNWHRSKFFSADIPFRYRFITSGSADVSGKAVRQAGISWRIPFYSDPYIDNDVMRRSENSDILNLIMEGTKPDTTISTDSIGSYVWSLNSSLSLAPERLRPYVNDFSVTSFSSAVSFSNRPAVPAPDMRLSYPPSLHFFHPDKFTLFSIALTAGGTPLVLGEGQKAAGKGGAAETVWGRARPPWEEGDEERPPAVSGELSPPVLGRAVSVPALGGQRLTLDYRISPSAASEVKLNSSAWNSPGDINWGDMAYQLYTFRADGSVGLTLAEKRGIYTNTVRLYGTSSWQDYTYLNEDAPEYNTPQKRETAKRQVHNMTYFTSSAEYTFTVRPFYQSEIWQTTNFQYSLKGLVVKSSYGQNDTWDTVWGQWTRDDIEFHRSSAHLNANIMDKMQTLSLTADLPPEEGALSGDATMRVWVSETNARSRIRDPFGTPFYEPVYFTETLRFTEKLSLRHYMVYDPELSDFTIMTTSFNWAGFNASFTAARSKGYLLIDSGPNSGWYINTGEEKLNPQNLSLGYQGSKTANEGGKVRFGGSINTGLSFDLQRYTYSKFFFTLELNAAINRFLDIRLGSHSENAVIYRYMQDWPFFDHIKSSVPGEKNVFVDLFNSFRFDDIQKRRESGFKLKSFTLDFVHHLGDWDATLGIKLAPELADSGGKKQYKFNTEVSFIVAWKPIKEFKTEMNYNKDGFSYK